MSFLDGRGSELVLEAYRHREARRLLAGVVLPQGQRGSDWRRSARPNQVAPEGDWAVWLILAGRGWGKTRTGAEWIREQVEAGARRLALVGPTAADVRDVMIEGESGVLRVCGEDADYEPSKRRITFARTGAVATAYSADEPDRLRGPQHDAAWGDEVASWRYPEAWDQLLFGLRLGQRPRAVVTTTPRPTKLIRGLAAHPATVVTRGSTYENAANLAPAFIEQIRAKYEGTRLGRQELHAEILEDVEGALWTLAMIEAAYTDSHPTLRRIVVAVDPAVSNGPDSDETGIMVAALGDDGRGYVLGDLSGRFSPGDWAARAVGAFNDQEADRIIAEVNNGGDLVEANIRTVSRTVPVTKVHASRGKRTRAEPVAALYEQHRVHHVGRFPALEDQLTQWVPDAGLPSPDRMDALVWALWELFRLGEQDRRARFG